MAHTENGTIAHGTNAVEIDPATYVHISREEMRNNLPDPLKLRNELIRLRKHLVLSNAASGLDPRLIAHAARIAELKQLSGGELMNPESAMNRIRDIEEKLKDR